MQRRKLLVCDLDNTLYDWVSYFVPSFYAMVDVAVDIMSCDRERLLDDFRSVHQSHHDSEQPFALLETDTVRRRYVGVPIEKIVQILDPAFHAFNSTRIKNLHLNDGVRESLELLEKQGVILIAHTESKLYAAVDRLRRLDLFRFFRKVYCRERSRSVHATKEIDEGWLRAVPLEKIRELSHHQAKPSPDVLLEICATERVSRQATAYVGDSLARDVLMAKRAGVFAIWAAYGANHDRALYSALVRISHWTPSEVEREERLRREAELVEPDYVAYKSFREVAAAIVSGDDRREYTAV